MNVAAWLHQNAPGFRDLSGEERNAIMHFSLLWSLFEADALKTNGNVNAIVKLTEYWAGQGAFTKDTFAITLVAEQMARNAAFSQ